MSSTAALYSSEVLGLATSIASYPLHEGFDLHGDARAPVCGSTIEVGLALDGTGRIARIGMRVHACAIGQAAASLFAGSATGRNRSDVSATLAGLESWLTDPAAPLPDWPGLTAIAAARTYPARHGAIVLPWKAALVALP